MPIIDLTHPIHPGMPVYPDDEQPEITCATTIERHGYRTQRLLLTTHTGTHLDAPAHLLPGGKSLDRFPVDHFQGRAQVVDCRTLTGEIPLAYLQPITRLQEAAFVLLHTGWDRHWGTERYFTGYPVLSAEAAHWLASLPIKGIGVDAISLDSPAANLLPNHHALLGREKIIIENLTHVDAIPGQACQLYCLPLLITAADAAPARVIAVTPG